MILARLIGVAFLTGVMGSTSFAPSVESAPPSKLLRDLATPEADFRGCDRDASTIDIAGEYTATSTTVLMPGTEGALRVIEFTADRTGGQEQP
jgi:hypothetical protein